MRLRERAKPPRCSYCHADFGKEDIRCGCGGSHTECAMENGECPACGEAMKPDMTWLEKKRDRLVTELDRVELELNLVEATMEEEESSDRIRMKVKRIVFAPDDGDSSDQLRTQLEAGLERIGLESDEVTKTANEFFGAAFVGSTCSACRRSYTMHPTMGRDTRCYECWHESVEAEHPAANSVSWTDIIFFVILLVVVIFGILRMIL